MHLGLLIVGMDHYSVPAHLVERVRDRDHVLREAIAQLRGSQDISEIIYRALPTRTDIIVATWNPITAASLVLDMLAKVLQLRTEDWTAFYRHIDEAAVAHLLSAASEPDAQQPAIQLESLWQQPHRSGVAGRLLCLLMHAVQQHASGSTSPTRAKANQIWSKLQAEDSLHPSAKVRKEVDAICSEEIDSFRRSCGGLMTDDQEKAVKIVTARISERVGEWITRAWNEPNTGLVARIRENS